MELKPADTEFPELDPEQEQIDSLKIEMEILH